MAVNKFSIVTYNIYMFIRFYQSFFKMVQFLPYITSLYNSFINIKYKRFSMAYKLKILISSFHESGLRLLLCNVNCISFLFDCVNSTEWDSMITTQWFIPLWWPRTQQTDKWTYWHVQVKRFKKNLFKAGLVQKGKQCKID